MSIFGRLNYSSYFPIASDHISRFPYFDALSRFDTLPLRIDTNQAPTVEKITFITSQVVVLLLAIPTDINDFLMFLSQITPTLEQFICARVSISV